MSQLPHSGLTGKMRRTMRRRRTTMTRRAAMRLK